MTQKLPPLSEETIERAKQGLDFARDRHIHEMITEALLSNEAVVEKGFRQKIRGEVRRRVLRALIHTFFEVKVEFPERIPTTPVLLAANHLNHIDPFLLLSELPATPFYHILGDARTLYNQWWKRFLLRKVKGVIPLERIWKEEIAVIEGAKSGREDLADLAVNIEKYLPQGNSIQSLRQLDRIVQNIFTCGDGIILFPEGRLGNVEGELSLPLKRGAAIYALRSGIPILPVVLTGTQDLYFRKELTIKFGEALIVPQSSRPKPQQIQAVVDDLQAGLINLMSKYSEPEEPKRLRQFLNHMFW